MPEFNPSIELWSVDKLVPYENNAKKHPDEQVAKLAKSIEKFGWTQPITIWKNGEIIAGHGRRLAAIKLGLKKVPVVVRSDLTKVEADALRLADNRVASTEYDHNLLQQEIMALSDLMSGEDLELSDMGFDPSEIEFAMDDVGEIDDSFFTKDLARDVEEQRQQNEEAVERTDQIAAPVGDALGFKRITIEQSRALRSHMIKVEEATGLVGVDGLLKFFEENLEMENE